MKTLNDPVPIEENDDDWSPGKGLARAGIRGTVTAAILAGALLPVAYYAPYVVLGALSQAAVGFAVAWILFSVVHRAAGMVGGRCSVLAITLTVVVLLSNHLIFAIHGVPTRQGLLLIGWLYWFDPLVLCVSNVWAVIGIAFCTSLRHSGGADASDLAGMLTRGVYGYWRDKR